MEFVLPGCAIFAAIHHIWPTPEIVVADRGLREGMLLRMIRAERSNGSRRAARRRVTRREVTGPPGREPAPRGLAVKLRTAKGLHRRLAALADEAAQ